MAKTKTLKVRVKDKHAKLLSKMARSVNFVWNYINELSFRSIKERGMFLSAYDIRPYTKGAGKELGLHSHTLQCIAAEYVTRRKQFKKARLNWRKSRGVRRSLGCKESATDSNGNGVTGREYRMLEQKSGIAQRANNKQRAKAIHAKIKNRRQDALHKYSRKLVNENAAIFVGNVSSQAMVKTKKAKSVLDAGWGLLKTMLSYKCDHAGVVFEIVNEAYSTQTCSCCGVIPDSSPKGRASLGIREWVCSEC
nr:transposase [Salinisphaera sp. G21_0]